MLWFNLISGIAIQSYFVFSQFGFTHKKKKALGKCVQIVKCQLNVIFQVRHSNRALWKLVVIHWELKERSLKRSSEASFLEVFKVSQELTASPHKPFSPWSPAMSRSFQLPCLWLCHSSGQKCTPPLPSVCPSVTIHHWRHYGTSTTKRSHLCSHAQSPFSLAWLHSDPAPASPGFNNVVHTAHFSCLKTWS